MKKFLSVTALCSCVAAGAGLGSAWVQGQTGSQGIQRVSDFPDLVTGLKNSPGCLGVEPVSAKNGKQLVIFAWFKNKKAVVDWYHSPMHRQAMNRFFPGQGREPLALVKDENSPIMVIASVTPSEKPVEGQTLAVCQIAIELYTPLSGGAALGNRFAPESVPVEGLIRIGAKPGN